MTTAAEAPLLALRLAHQMREDTRIEQVYNRAILELDWFGGGASDRRDVFVERLQLRGHCQ